MTVSAVAIAVSAVPEFVIAIGVIVVFVANLDGFP